LSATRAIGLGSLFLLAIASPAVASPLLLGGNGLSIERRVMVLSSDSVQRQQTLIEEVHLKGRNTRFAWLSAFPSEPIEVRAVAPEALAELERLTHVPPPRHKQAEERVFGPSILSWLLGPPASSSTVAAAGERLRINLTTRTRHYFSGPTTTSTVNGQRFLPERLAGWLEVSGFTLSRLQREALMSYCDAGWTIAATLVETSAPDVVLGPTLYRFAGEAPVVPLKLSAGDAPAEKTFTFYLHGDEPLILDGREVRYTDAPWAPPAEADRGSFRVSYHQEIAAEGAGPALTTLLGRAVAGGHLVRAELLIPEPIFTDLGFEAVPDAKILPGPGRRGGALDLFWCLLIGLMPLFYTPEAWLFLWLGYNARVDRRPNQPLPMRGHLWAYYALVVACFWVATQEGAGRIAALGPLVIAVVRLWPQRELERRPVRIDFRRKKRGAATAKPSAAPPRPTQKPAPAAPKAGSLAPKPPKA
jgi:hypothetical protein